MARQHSTPAGDGASAGCVSPAAWARIRAIPRQAQQPHERRLAASWTIDTLEGLLGRDWPRQALVRGDAPAQWVGCGDRGGELAFVRALELAARCRLLQRTPGFGRARRAARHDRRAGPLLHFAYQTTLAALARRLDWEVRLETGRPPADLWLSMDGRGAAVETRVLEHRAGGPEQDQQVRAQQLLASMMRALRYKSRAMRSSGAAWLCLESLDGLPRVAAGAGPAALPRREQLEHPESLAHLDDLECASREALAGTGIEGVVLSSAACACAAAAHEQLYERRGGTLVLRLPVLPWRARELLIIPLRDGADVAAQAWRTLLGSEHDWLAWALHELRLPSLQAIVADHIE